MYRIDKVFNANTKQGLHRMCMNEYKNARNRHAMGIYLHQIKSEIQNNKMMVMYYLFVPQLYFKNRN